MSILFLFQHKTAQYGYVNHGFTKENKEHNYVLYYSDGVLSLETIFYSFFNEIWM